MTNSQYDKFNIVTRDFAGDVIDTLFIDGQVSVCDKDDFPAIFELLGVFCDKLDRYNDRRDGWKKTSTEIDEEEKRRTHHRRYWYC